MKRDASYPKSLVVDVVEKSASLARLGEAMLPVGGRSGGNVAEDEPKDDNGDAEGTGDPCSRLSRNHVRKSIDPTKSRLQVETLASVSSSWKKKGVRKKHP